MCNCKKSQPEHIHNNDRRGNDYSGLAKRATTIKTHITERTNGKQLFYGNGAKKRTTTTTSRRSIVENFSRTNFIEQIVRNK